jgi:hypothetical protein
MARGRTEDSLRQVVTLFVAISCITFQAAAAETLSGAFAGGQPAVRACAVLTRDLVTPFTENKKMLDLLPPQEEVLGTSGTACEYGGVRLQLFPGRGGKRTPSAKGLEPVSGAGEGGYFRSNRNRYAELMVWTSKHSLDLQVSVPSGRTAEAIKPDVVALANAILAKLP